MTETIVKGPWGIVATPDVLQSAIRSWGPKPFFFDVRAVCLTGDTQNRRAIEEVRTYFQTKVFYDIKEFCRSCNRSKTGFVLNLAPWDGADGESLRPLHAHNKVVIDGRLGQLIWSFIIQLEKQTFQREVFFQALNSTAEGIQIADAQGREIFINDSLLKMIHLKMEDRLGKSVFEVSPDGGLARVLEKKVAVKNIRNRPQGTQVEFISNAGPIYINGKFCGAVTVAYDVTELTRLSKELEANKQAVEFLDKKVGHLASAKYTFQDIIGDSPQMRDVIETARKAAASDLAILILGESGTGKEIFAHAIHNSSARQSRPFIAVNCAAIPEQLLESEFFGYEKGAFTSATARKLGLFDLANTGTLFLDEIGDMNLNLQSKLLRVLQDKEYIRVGGTKSVKADVRIIAATHRDLAALVYEGKFREDLFYRLNVINLTIPPLRARMADLKSIAAYLLRRIGARVGTAIQEISDEALASMALYPWPGNIRELENVLERGVFLCQGHLLKDEDIRLPSLSPGTRRESDSEKEKIHRYLQFFGYSVTGKKEAAHRLNMSLSTLYNKIKLYHLQSKP